MNGLKLSAAMPLMCVALSAFSDAVVLRETVLDVASRSEVSGSAFSFDGQGVLCATQVMRTVRLGGAQRPGSTPFRGVSEIVVETPGISGGGLSLGVVNRDTGEKKTYSAKWQERSVFATDLDCNSWYQFDELYFNPGSRSQPIAKLPVSGIWGRRTGTPAEAIVIDVDTGNDLHLADDPSAIAVLLRNVADRELSATGTVTLAHYFGEELRIPFAGTVAPGRVLRLPVGKRLKHASAPLGLWQVRSEVFAEGTRAFPEASRFAVLNRRRVSPRLPLGTFRLGIQVHYPATDSPDYPRVLQALRMAGCKLVRGGDFGFSHCWRKSEMPEPDFTNTDRIVADLKRLGISLNVNCWPNPPWSSPVPKAGYLKIIRTHPLPGLMGRYCEKLARHYGTDIDYIETSNEPDLWQADEFPAADYISYQKECYEGVKRGCPTIRVMPGGFGTTSSANPRINKRGFHEAVMRESKGYCDVHPIHQHGAFSGYENALLSQFFPMRERERITVPWFPNETGLTMAHGDETRVAVTVWQKILFSQAHGACDYVWYNLRATRWSPKNAEGGYGMMTRDWYPRAAYAAYSALAHAISGYSAEGIVCEYKGRHLYRFAQSAKNGKNVVFAGWDGWSNGDGRIRIRSNAARAVAIDMMGNEHAVKSRNGCFDFAIGTRPAALRLYGAGFAEAVAEDVNDVPLPKLDARVVVSAIDGRSPDFVLDKVAQVTQLYEANPETEHRTWKGPDDLSAKIWIGRTPKRLMIRFAVVDDLHVQRVSAPRLYLNDGLQFILEAPGQSGNFEFGLARSSDGQPLKALWITPVGFTAEKVMAAAELKTSREGKVTTYDFSVPFSAIGFDEKTLTNGIRFNAIVYDDDGMGKDRDGWIEIKPGIAGAKQYQNCPSLRFEPAVRKTSAR